MTKRDDGMAQSYRNRVISLFLVTVIMLVAVLWIAPQMLKKPEHGREDTVDHREVTTQLAYYDRGWNEETRGLPSLKTHYGSIHLLSPNWYGVDAGGNIVLSRGEIEGEISNIATREGIKILPLVTNYRGNHQVLMNQAVLQKAAGAIAGMVIKNNYDGVNIDFEMIPPWYAEQLAELVRLVAQELRPYNKIVAVSVFPKIDFPERLHGVHDYEKLVTYTDYVCLMAYDRHSPRTGPGPVAPLTWVEDNIRHALTTVPPEKLILGVAAYGYDWSEDGTGAEPLGLNQALQRSQQYEVEHLWDQTSQSSYYLYRKNEIRHEVWFESEYSVGRKTNLVEKYNLAGLAFWRLGYETKAYMKALE